ncbi:MAG: beta-ketoacyl-[acyl-carrier-protein] synthase family protein [Candidatus Anammoxibacter sp.]
MDNRIVVTGLGIISSVGTGIEENWANVVAGKSGIDILSKFDSEMVPVKMACEVKDFKPKEYIKDRKSLKIMYRNVQLGLATVQLAVEHSGLETGKIDPVRFGSFIGSGGGGFDEGPHNKDLAGVITASWDEDGKRFDSIKFGSLGIDKLHPLWLLKTLPNNVFCYLSIYHNVQGVNDNVITSFTSGSQAIGDGFSAIKRGDADVIIAGGYDTLIMPNNFFCFDGLNMLTKGNDDLSSFRPFDKDRNGFVLGEGAGMVILEELSHAKKRGAKIYGEIVGYGNTSNAQHLYEPPLNGAGIKAAIKKACRKAQINLTDIDYINADGIGTVRSDKAETNAIKDVFAEHAHKTVISSTKPIMGHTGAASGAIELILCAMAIEKKTVPPTINLENPDPECDLDYCPKNARDMEINAALSINQGIGGQNSALIIKKYKG